MRTYVVIHDAISFPKPGGQSVGYTRGQVFSVPDEGKDENIDEAVRRAQYELGAVRPATEEEAGHDRVNLPGRDEASRSAEDRVAQLEEENAKLREQLGSMRQRIADQNRADSIPQDEFVEKTMQMNVDLQRKNAAQAVMSAQTPPNQITGTVSTTTEQLQEDEGKEAEEEEEVEGESKEFTDEELSRANPESDEEGGLPADFPGKEELEMFFGKDVTLSMVRAKNQAELIGIPGIGSKTAAKILQRLAENVKNVDQ